MNDFEDDRLDKWQGYRSLHYAFDSTVPPTFQRPIENAFRSWQATIPLKFHPTPVMVEADIVIKFANQHPLIDQLRQDPDWPVGVSFPPPKQIGRQPGVFSEIVFFSGVAWRDYISQPEADWFDVESSALHAIGHLLGIRHSHDASDVMYFDALRPFSLRVALSPRDILAAQRRYAPRINFDTPFALDSESDHLDILVSSAQGEPWRGVWSGGWRRFLYVAHPQTLMFPWPPYYPKSLMLLPGGSCTSSRRNDEIGPGYYFRYLDLFAIDNEGIPRWGTPSHEELIEEYPNPAYELLTEEAKKTTTIPATLLKGSYEQTLRGWFPLPGHPLDPATPISSASFDQNHIDVFAACSPIPAKPGQHFVCRNSFNVNWSGWIAIGKRQFDPLTPVTVVRKTEGFLDLFAVGQDGLIYWAYFDGNWSDWFPVGSGSPSFPAGSSIAAVSRNPNQIDIFCVADDGKVWSSFWNGSPWSTWFEVSKQVVNQFPPGAPISATTKSPDHMDVVAIGNDRRLHHASWNGNPWQTQKVTNDVFEPRSYLRMVSRNPNIMEVIVVGIDGNIGTKTWNGSWQKWYPIPV